MRLSGREGEGKPASQDFLQRLVRIIISWLTQTHIEVDSIPHTLLDNGDKYHTMLVGSIAKPFKKKGHQFVYRIDTPTGCFYLKRTAYQSPRSILRHLLRGRRAHTEVGWEYLAIRALQAHDFRVMQPVVICEQHWLGFWPRRGFLLVREVLGKELVELFSTQENAALRSEALSALGYYIGRMHGSGFFHAARVHDFIYDRACDGGDYRTRLTMIDLDFKGLLPIPRPFNADKAIEALAESHFVFLRVGHRTSEAEAYRFIRGYKSGLRNCGQKLPSKYLNALAGAVTRRLDVLAHNPDQRTMFPGAPASIADAFLRP